MIALIVGYAKLNQNHGFKVDQNGGVTADGLEGIEKRVGSWGIKQKQQRQKQKHLPRTNTEFHGKKAEAFATD